MTRPGTGEDEAHNADVVGQKQLRVSHTYIYIYIYI